MKIKLKIISPVHIGSGEEISPVEYLVDKDKFIRLNMRGLFKDRDFKKYQERFIEESSHNRYIGNFVPPDILRKYPLYSISMDPEAEKYVQDHKTTIKSVIKSAGRVFIPGSSLKGSILSAVMEKVLKDKRERNLGRYQSLLDQVIGEISERPQNNRFSRWLDVVDSDFKRAEEALQLSLAKLVGARSEKEMPMLYETIKEGIEFNSEIKTSLNSVDKWGKLTEEEILKIADEFYRKVYKRSAASAIALPEKGFLLRLGQGSTAYSTSFLILAEELGIKNYTIQRPSFHRTFGPPKTKKLISGKKPLGWTEISYE